MRYAKDLHAIPAHAIGDDVPGLWHDKLSSAWHSPRSAQAGLSGQGRDGLGSENHAAMSQSSYAGASLPWAIITMASR